MPALIGGLLIGVSLGLLGSGGSILTVPVLVYGLGHVERVAVAESLLIVGVIALLASMPYVRAQRVCWRSVVLFGLPGMVGTWLGAVAATYFEGAVQLLVFGVVMLVAAVFMLSNGLPAEAQGRKDHPAILVAVEGIAVGAVTGFVGVGGGFLIVPALVFLRGLHIHYAIGTSLLIIAMKSTVGFAKYLDILRVENLAVDWPTIGVFVMLGALGAFLGSRISYRLNPRVLRRTFAIFLIVMAVFILFREGRSLASPIPSGQIAQASIPEAEQ
jgi:uncharacterized membrane protein YfcA